MSEPLPSYDRWGSLKGKRILVRVDFNTPVAEVDGVLEVSDDFRIRATLPLFEELLSRGAVVVACTHFGRPKGQVVEKYSVEPVRRRLHELCREVELLELAADGSSGITSSKEMDDVEAAGRAVEVGSNFFLFFSSQHSSMMRGME